jgi:hypothetical protein
MLFTQKLSGVCGDISSTPHPVAKVIRTGVHKLSGLRCVSYHAIRTKVTDRIFHQLSLPPSPKLPRPRYISYQLHDVWVTIYSHKSYRRDISSTLSPYQSYQDRGAWVIRSAVCELPCYSHKSYHGILHQPPLPHLPRRQSYISYQICDVWVTMLFT